MFQIQFDGKIRLRVNYNRAEEDVRQGKIMMRVTPSGQVTQSSERDEAVKER